MQYFFLIKIIFVHNVHKSVFILCILSISYIVQIKTLPLCGGGRNRCLAATVEGSYKKHVYLSRVCRIPIICGLVISFYNHYTTKETNIQYFSKKINRQKYNNTASLSLTAVCANQSLLR